MALAMFVTSLLVVASLVTSLVQCDVTGTDPFNGACLCVTSPSTFIRDSACGNIIGPIVDGQCFRYTGTKQACAEGPDTVEYFRVDYLDKTAWVAGYDVLDEADSNCGPRPDELKVIVLGDWGEQLLRGQDMVAAGMANWSDTNNPAWLITTGDNIYPEGIQSWDDPQMDRKWRDVYYQDSIKNLSWYVTIGNHDFGDWTGDEWNEVELSKHEPRWILPHLWYDFVEQRGDHSVHFIIFDTESFGHQINNYTDMMDWFEATLRDSTADWKLVVAHRHIFAVGDVFAVSDDDRLPRGAVTDNLFNYLVPLMERYGVDAYVCGHDHNLQHIKNITGEGIDYVLSGAGGALLSRYIPANEDLIRQYGFEALFFQMTYGFVTLTTRRSQLLFDYYNQDAELIYTFARDRLTNK